MIDPIMISSLLGFGVLSSLLIWSITRVDTIRKELHTIHINDLRHVEDNIQDIKTDIENIKLKLQVILISLNPKSK